MIKNIRRVVTGIDTSGRSIVLFDGEPPNSIEPVPGMTVSDIWETSGSKNNVHDAVDTAARAIKFGPALGGAIFKAITFPPMSEYGDEKWPSAMHRTNTVDYVIVANGEIYCVLDDAEVYLAAGDALVQRGTNHAWENRSNQPCTIIAVMLDNSERG